MGKPKGFIGGRADCRPFANDCDGRFLGGCRGVKQQIPHGFTHPSALIMIMQACSLFSGH